MTKEKKSAPFFQRFLEDSFENQMDSVKGGKTNKFPSDSDEQVEV